MAKKPTVPSPKDIEWNDYVFRLIRGRGKDIR